MFKAIKPVYKLQIQHCLCAREEETEYPVIVANMRLGGTGFLAQHTYHGTDYFCLYYKTILYAVTINN